MPSARLINRTLEFRGNQRSVEWMVDMQRLLETEHERS